MNYTRAWIKNGWRPIYGCRQIRRGKNKGRYEVRYLRAPGKYRKAIVPSNYLVRSTKTNLTELAAYGL